MAEESDSKQSVEKKQNWVLIGAAIVLVLLAAYFLFRAPAEQASSIAGRVNFTNIKPEPGSTNQGEITLFQREVIEGETTEFVDTGVKIDAVDETEWKWVGGEEPIDGRVYELRGDLYWSNQFIKRSNVVTTAAPAAGQILIFDVSLDDVPENILEQVNVPISGYLDLNGYIPEDSTVDIYQKQPSTGVWEAVVEDLPAKDKSRWVWDDAVPNRPYEIKAVMMNGSANIGESTPSNVTPPASDVVLTVVSTAQAPGATISGSVQVNGAVVNDTSIIMLQSPTGTDNFKEFQTLSAIDGVEFNWGNATPGEAYDVKAELRQGEDRIATSNVVTSTAPSSDLTLVLDTKLTLSTPKESPRVTCKDQDKEGNYEVSITYPRITDSARYYVQVGSDKESNDVYKSVIDNNNPNEDIKVSVKVSEGEDRYTSYAYTYCSNCDTTDRQNWSALSPVTKFKCPVE